METLGLVYTESDAEEDATLFMTEAFDFSSYAILDTDECIPRSDSTECSNENLVNFSIDKHLQAMRALAIAEAVLGFDQSESEFEHWDMVESNTDKNKSELEKKWPMKVRLNTQPTVETSSWAADYDYDVTNGRLKQLRKDIERDQLLINSQLSIGASVSLGGTLSVIGKICDRIMSENHFPSLPGVAKNHFAHCILMKASRTNAGGIAFSVLQNMIDARIMTLLPQSHITPPIRVNIRLGRFPSSLATSNSNGTSNSHNNEHTSPSWGLLCQIVCDSYYAVRRTDDLLDEVDTTMQQTGSGDQHELAGRIVRATYEDYVLFELKLYGNEIGNLQRVVDDSRILGQVVLQPID